MNFWTRYGSTRLSRRRAIVATGGVAASAAFLAACGGGGNKDTTPASGLLAAPQETSGQAKAGGVYHTYAGAPLTLDPVAAALPNTVWITSSYAYPRLLKFKAVKYPDSTAGEVEGDLAESYELSADKLTLTMKLRQGLKWDLKSPRNIDAEDVIFSWKRITALSPFKSTIDNKSNPDAPIESVTAPDSRTIVVKLAKPDPSIYGLIATPENFIIMPREADGGFDPKQEIRGYGPWLFDSYHPSQSLNYKKNPDYYVKGRPYFDRVEINDIPEYAARLAQFRAGNLWSSVVNMADILQTKRDLPELVLQRGQAYPFAPGGAVVFGYEGNSPFKDVRVRQALGFTIDREEYKDQQTNYKVFESEGIDLQLRAQSTVAAGWEDHWLNPLDEKVFGPNAKYYKTDIAEAKKLMSAAGVTSGVDSTLLFITPTATSATIISEQFKNAGIRTGLKMLTNADWATQVTGAYGSFVNNGFNGAAVRPSGNYSDVALTVANLFLAGNKAAIGMTPDGKNAEKGDPEIQSIVVAMRSEWDANKVKDLSHKFQRAVAPKAYLIPTAWASAGLTLTWPVVGNLGVHRSSSGRDEPSETMIHLWADNTKAPVKKA